MGQGDEDGDDLAVNLSWPGAGAVVPEPPHARPAPRERQPPAGEEATRPAPTPRSAPPRPAQPRPGPPRPSPASSTQPRSFPHPPAKPRSAPQTPTQPPRSAAPGAAPPRPAPPPRPARPPEVPRGRPSQKVGAPPSAAAVGPKPPTPRPRPREEPPANGAATNETLLSVLEHLNTLSSLVTGTSKASAAELDALGSRVEHAVTELDGLRTRVLRSLAGFDALRLRVQQELADRPPLTDDDVDRIADAVTHRLLAHVRVEAEGGPP